MIRRWKKYSLFAVAWCVLSMPFFASAQTAADGTVPTILPRALWETGASANNLLNWIPEDNDPTSVENENPNSNSNIPDYSPVDRFVIHDTGCSPTSARCNSDTVDPISVIQSMYRNHAQVRGWGDIGYHYIIDRKGNIYEGRYGGNGTRGAHVYDNKNCRNFNVGTVGITILGNYGNAQVPAAAVNALAQLVGWLSAVNNINPADTARSTPVWTNLTTNGKCDTHFGGFSSLYAGPTVLGHMDLEAGNPDPGTLNMPALRTVAAQWREAYKNYIYQDKNDKAAVAIDGGVIKMISDNATALPAGETRPVVKINTNQLALFPHENAVKLPDGTLIKSSGRGDIYRLENGERRHVTSPGVFRMLGLSLTDVKVLADRDLLGYASGDPLSYPDGTLLQSPKDGKVYLIKDGERRHIISSAAFKQNKFKEKDIIKVPEDEVAAYVSGGIVGLPEGTLFSVSPKVTAPNYVVMNGGKKFIPSWDIFNAWKFDKKKIRVIAKKDLDLYPDKGELLLPDASLIRAAGMPEIYIVHKQKKYWIGSYGAFAELKLNMTAVKTLPVTETGKYRSGGTIASSADWQTVIQGKPLATAAVAPAPVQPAQKQLVPVATSAGQTIKVGLFSAAAADNVSVTANGSFTVRSGKTSTEKTYAAGEIAATTWNTSGDTTFTAHNAGTIFTVNSYHVYNWDKSVDFNIFRGNLSLVYSQKSNKVWMVNVLPFEEYLQGLGEALNTDAPEYRKAFAVAARSYALYHLSNNGKYGADEVYHLNNTPSDQVYRGYAWEGYAPNLVEATKATAGEVMKYNGKIARTVYSSDSGGTTKNACSLWGGEFCNADYGYLAGGITDPEGTVRRDAATIAASHGVGMSATGARRLAELGKTYKEILAYYYKGISVEKVY
mgnify:CR=1 FL=1